MEPRTPRRAAALAALGLLAGCAVGPGPEGARPDGLSGVFPLFEAGDAVEKDWQVVRFRRAPEFGVAAVEGRPALRIAADDASGGLGRWLEIDAEACPVVEWTWRVDSLPDRADLASREAEDVAASLSFVFGDPGSLTLPRPRPIIRYVWATERDAAGSVVASPYFPDHLRSLVVRSGPAGLGEAVTERRDLLTDYRAVFGEAPREPVRLFVLFTDTDHGGGAAEAFYFDASALCSEDVAEDGLPFI